MFQKFLFNILFFVWVVFANGQANLVPNPSFETYTACPDGYSEIDYTGDWYTPTLATSDFFNACDTSRYYSVPLNDMDYQKAFNNGDGYAGFIAYSSYTTSTYPEWTEYIQTQLTSSLSPGQKYYCSFYVSLAERSMYATDVVSLCFSQSAITSNQSSHLHYTPQISSPAGIFLTDSLNWTPVSGFYTAFGGERYITIGVFKSASSTATVQANTSTFQQLGPMPFAYYYVDQVCVSTSSVTCKVIYPVGIDEHPLETSFFYYDQQFKKLIFSDPSENVLVTITDLMGKQVQSTTLNGANDMDVSGLEPGCYFVSINTSNDKYVKKIFVE